MRGRHDEGVSKKWAQKSYGGEGIRRGVKKESLKGVRGERGEGGTS